MAIGIIKSLRDRGFGFIARDQQGPRTDALFFHRSAVEGDGFDGLREGQRVSFDVAPDPRDPTRRRAVNVRPEPTRNGQGGASAATARPGSTLPLAPTRRAERADGGLGRTD